MKNQSNKNIAMNRKMWFKPETIICFPKLKKQRKGEKGEKNGKTELIHQATKPIPLISLIIQSNNLIKSGTS